jgi:8-oxo-dGTP pyrophosphatase MutT (NUDIX family)
VPEPVQAVERKDRWFVDLSASTAGMRWPLGGSTMLVEWNDALHPPVDGVKTVEIPIDDMGGVPADPPEVDIKPTGIVGPVRVILPDDEWSSMTVHEVEHPSGARRVMRVSHNRSSVVVVAIDTMGWALLVRQWKHAVGRITTEFPAGYLVDEREDPVLAGQRELREETGHGGGRWIYLGAYLREPGRGRTAIHFCVALGVTSVGKQSPDDTEQLEFEVVPPAHIDEMMRDGRMPGLHCLGAWAVARPYVFPPADPTVPPMAGVASADV